MVRLLQLLGLGTGLGGDNAGAGVQALEQVSVSVNCEGAPDGCITREAIRSISLTQGVEATENSSFDVDRLMTCMADMSTETVDLVKLSDVAWTKLVDYHNNAGYLNEPTVQQSEFDVEVAPMQLHDGSVFLPVKEPCKTVSSLSYYRQIYAFCESDSLSFGNDDIKKTYAQLMALHGYANMFTQVSDVGEVGQLLYDVTLQLLTLNAYQGAIQKFSDDNVLYSFMRFPKYRSAQKGAEALADIILNKDPSVWADDLEEMSDNLPWFDAGIAGTATVIANLLLPREVAAILNTAVGAWLGGPTYALNLGPALREVDVNFSTIMALTQMGIGTGIKALYSLFWQTEITDPVAISNGASVMPMINALGNLLTGFDRSYDSTVQEGSDVYPGDQACRSSVGFSIFNEGMANTLVDYGMLNSAVNDAINGMTLTPDMDGLEMAICYDEAQCFDGFDMDLMGGLIESNFNECLGHLTFNPEVIPMIDISSFATCIFTSLIWAEGIQTLDSCLGQNNCIRFNDKLVVESEPILNCVLEEGYTAPEPEPAATEPVEPAAEGTLPEESPLEPVEPAVVEETAPAETVVDETGPGVRALQDAEPVEPAADEVAPIDTIPEETTPAEPVPVVTAGSCASFVDQQAFTTCYDGCEDTSCMLRCLVDTGFDDSSLFSTAFACLSAFTSGDEVEAAEFKTLCTSNEVILSEEPSFIQLFIKGMRQLVLCSAESCSSQHKNFLNIIYDVPSCASDCLAKEPADRMFPDTMFLPEELSCNLECFIAVQTPRVN